MSKLTKQRIEKLEVEAYENAMKLEKDTKNKIDINSYTLGAIWILEKLDSEQPTQSAEDFLKEILGNVSFEMLRTMPVFTKEKKWIYVKDLLEQYTNQCNKVMDKSEECCNKVSDDYGNCENCGAELDDEDFDGLCKDCSYLKKIDEATRNGGGGLGFKGYPYE